jgi:hypothetical protein
MLTLTSSAIAATTLKLTNRRTEGRLRWKVHDSWSR